MTGETTSAVDTLLDSPHVWRGHGRAHPAAGLPSGYPALDGCLPGGGWPVHTLSEILLDDYGIGELELLMPALASLTASDPESQDRDTPAWIAWIAPPFQPYPPALAELRIDVSRVLVVRPRNAQEVLWSAEQALSCGTCAAVLLWPARLDDQSSRRLQLAAEKGASWAIAFRPLQARREPSAAALRIMLETAAGGTDLSIIKSRGGQPAVLQRFFEHTSGADGG